MFGSCDFCIKKLGQFVGQELFVFWKLLSQTIVMLFPIISKLFSLLYHDNFVVFRRFSDSDFFVRSNFCRTKL